MDQQKIWDHYQSDESVETNVFAGAQARYEYIAKRVPERAVVLNIGVGRGGLEELLVSRGCFVHALDPGEGAIEAIRKRLKLAERARVGVSQDIPFDDNTFDVVVMSEVLEHLTDEVIEATTKEVRRVLRAEGRFIGTVPANEVLEANACVCPECATVFHRFGHQQTFHRERLIETLGAHFTNIHVVRRYLPDSLNLNWRGHLMAIVKRFAMKVGLQGSNEIFYFDAVATDRSLV